MKPFSPAKSMQSSRKSPRKNTKYVLTKPNMPFGASSSIASSFEYDLGRSTFSIIKPEEVNRQDVRELKERTSEELHKLYEQEQRGHLPSMQRYVEQLKVLEGSMRDLGGMVRKHCNDQADLLDLVWSSAADLFSVVCKSLSDNVNDLEYRLAEEIYMHKKWKDKANMFKHRFQEAAEANDLTGKAVIDPSHLRDLEEEILIKDREIIKMQKTISNLSIWFPRFSKFSDSVLARFLPPVENIEDEDADEDDEELKAMSKVERQLTNMGKGKGKARKMGAQNIDPQVLEAMNLIRSKQLAQDNLLKDLKRLEQLGIGLHVLTGSDDMLALQRTFSTISDGGGANAAATPSNAHPHGVSRNSIMSTSHDESAALNMGLFNSPSIGASFSATTGLEYIMKNNQNTKASFVQQQKAGTRGSYVAGNGEKKGSFLAGASAATGHSFLSDEKIQEAASKVANLFQSSLSQPQQQQQLVPGKKKSSKKKKNKHHRHLSIHAPPPTVHSPVKTPVLTSQEFFRLQGRKFSQMVQVDDKFYGQEQYRQGTGGAEGEGGEHPNALHPGSEHGNDWQGNTHGHLMIDTNAGEVMDIQTMMEGEQFESGGEEESDDDEDDGNDHYLLLNDRFQQALKEVQALEIIHKKHVHHHDECVVQYDGVIKQLKSDIQVLRRQLGRANHSSTQMIKSLPPVIHTNLALHTLYNKLPGVVVVRVGEFISTDGNDSTSYMDAIADGSEQACISSIQHTLDMFLIQFSQAKLPSDLSIYNTYINTTAQPDSVSSNIYNTYLESTLNGQLINTHTLPLLGVQVLVQEFRERTSVFSLLGSVFMQNVGVMVKHASVSSKPDEVKHMLKSVLMILLHHIRQNMCVDIDNISMQSDVRSDANIDLHNAFIAYLTPATAMLHVFKMLFGLDQVRCVSESGGRDGDGWNAVRYIDHIQHFPRTRTMQSSSINVNNNTTDTAVGDGSIDAYSSNSIVHPSTQAQTHPLHNTMMDSIIEEEEDMDVFSLHPYLSDMNKDTSEVPEQKIKDSTVTRQEVSVSYSFPDTEGIHGSDVSFKAMNTIFSFDTYLHILRASLAFHNPNLQSTAAIQIPLKDTDRFIDRIFHVCSVSFMSAKLKSLQVSRTATTEAVDENKKKKNKHDGDEDSEDNEHGAVDGEGVIEGEGDASQPAQLQEGEEQGGKLLHSATQPPWWRFITRSTKSEFRRRLYRHAPQPHDSNSTEQAVGIPLPYYQYYALKSVQQTYVQLTYILRNMHKFMGSMLPGGVRDALYSPFLTYLLLTSPLLTHQLPSSTPTSTTRPHTPRPYQGSVPVPLLQEIISAHNSNSLTDVSFAEIVLRGGVRGLADTLTPLLAVMYSGAAESAGSGSSSHKGKSGAKGGILTDLSCSEPLSRLSQTLSSQYGRDDKTAAGISVDMGGSVGEEGEIKWVRRLVTKIGANYFILLQHLFELVTTEDHPSLQEAPPSPSSRPSTHPSSHPNPPKSLGYEEYVLIHRFLYNAGADIASATITPTPEDDPLVLIANRPFLTRLADFGSDFLQRLFAHTRLSFDASITSSVTVSFMQKYFVLVGCLFSFGHVRHSELLTHILSEPSHAATSAATHTMATTTITTAANVTAFRAISTARTYTASNHNRSAVLPPHPKEALLALWPSLQWDEEPVDAKVQFQYQQARLHYVGQLKKRVLRQWKKE